MSDFQVINKDLLSSVDRAADSFLVYDSDASALKRTTVNNALDLSSHPVGINDSQTLTSKTLTSPTISGPTLSGTISGTYTLGGTPTFPSSVATLTGPQTLTNKTLTSPTINTPTINNPTLNTDSVNEHTAANGVTIDGLNIKDSKLNTNNSVVTANITDDAVTGAKIGSYYIERQNNTSNSTENTAKFASGWGVITATAAASFSEAVTFPFTFTSRPIVVVSFGGDDTAGGTTYGDGGNERHGAVTAKAVSITTTGFTVFINQAAGSNWTAGDTLFYQWIAVGA